MLGIAAGNYACSLIYRLPINEPLFEKHPFCGSCKTFLKPKDLFPLFSWLLLRGKCRYCSASIPAIYTVTEIVFAILFCGGYLLFGFSERYILFLVMSCFAVIIAAIAFKKHYIEQRLILILLAGGLAYRTLIDASIYGFAGGLFTGGLVGLAAWQLIAKIKKQPVPVPHEVVLLAVAGACLGMPLFAVFLAVWLPVLILLITAAKNKAPYIRYSVGWWAFLLIAALCI